MFLDSRDMVPNMEAILTKDDYLYRNYGGIFMKINYDITTIGIPDIENMPAEEIKLFCSTLLCGILAHMEKVCD